MRTKIDEHVRPKAARGSALVNVSFVEESVGIGREVLINVRGWQSVNVVGDEVRESVAVIAKFAKRYDDLVEIGGISISPFGMRDASATAHGF